MPTPRRSGPAWSLYSVRFSSQPMKALPRSMHSSSPVLWQVTPVPAVYPSFMQLIFRSFRGSMPILAAMSSR